MAAAPPPPAPRGRRSEGGAEGSAQARWRRRFPQRAPHSGTLTPASGQTRTLHTFNYHERRVLSIYNTSERQCLYKGGSTVTRGTAAPHSPVLKQFLPFQTLSSTSSHPFSVQKEFFAPPRKRLLQFVSINSPRACARVQGRSDAGTKRSWLVPT